MNRYLWPTYQRPPYSSPELGVNSLVRMKDDFIERHFADPTIRANVKEMIGRIRKEYPAGNMCPGSFDIEWANPAPFLDGRQFAREGNFLAFDIKAAHE